MQHAFKEENLHHKLDEETEKGIIHISKAT